MVQLANEKFLHIPFVVGRAQVLVIKKTPCRVQLLATSVRPAAIIVCQYVNTAR